MHRNAEDVLAGGFELRDELIRSGQALLLRVGAAGFRSVDGGDPRGVDGLKMGGAQIPRDDEAAGVGFARGARSDSGRQRPSLCDSRWTRLSDAGSGFDGLSFGGSRRLIGAGARARWSAPKTELRVVPI